MKALRTVTALAATLVLAACSDPVVPAGPPDAAASGGELAAAKGGNGGGGPGSTVDQPVAFTWDDSVNGGVPGLRSDGGGDYTTNVCGVYTSFPLDSRYGDLTGDFDYNADGSCGPRFLTFDFTLGGGPAPSFGGTLITAPKFVVRGIDQMAVGESRLEWMGFGIQQENCGRVLYDGQYPGSSDVLITRLEDASNGARRWSIRTQGSETAVCVVAGKRNMFEVMSGPYFMPFAFTITEVR